MQGHLHKASILRCCTALIARVRMTGPSHQEDNHQPKPPPSYLPLNDPEPSTPKPSILNLKLHSLVLQSWGHQSPHPKPQLMANAALAVSGIPVKMSFSKLLGRRLASMVPLKLVEYAVSGDLIIIYPKPYSTYGGL